MLNKTFYWDRLVFERTSRSRLAFAHPEVDVYQLIGLCKSGSLFVSLRSSNQIILNFSSFDIIRFVNRHYWKLQDVVDLKKDCRHKLDLIPLNDLNT